MDLDWLEDLLALVEVGGFSRAAERRDVSQPAFSRRIKALEAWVGTPLLQRGSHRVALTPAGEHFLTAARGVSDTLRQSREEARELARSAESSFKFACTYALSLTFFTSWLKALEDREPILTPVRLMADNMETCERLLLRGEVQFMLCHFHPASGAQLPETEFKSVQVGGDRLVPVCAPRFDGKPMHPLPGTPEAPVRLLSYARQSGLGRILAAAHRDRKLVAEESFAAQVSTVLAGMAREGRGATWLPFGLISSDLETGRLVRAGGEEWDVPMEVRLYRPIKRLPPAAEKFWLRTSQGPVSKYANHA